MIDFLSHAFIGFAVGVVTGPVFMAKVWPRIKAWWADLNTDTDGDA
jgi:hypothetical protein